MKYIKLFEEYRFFKVKKSNDRTELAPPEGDDKPYWNRKYSKTNVYDPNEPFLNRNKFWYFHEMGNKNYKDMVGKNQDISFNRACDKMNIDRTDLDIFLKQNNLIVSNVWYDNNDNYWSASIDDNRSFSSYWLDYFPKENDYIGTYHAGKDYDEHIRKRFSSASDYFIWFTIMKSEQDKRRREKLRKTTPEP
jgi:hypothetical protein